MRGEYLIGLPLGAGLSGSSPHAWGIRRRKRQRVPGQRFIPTCVGNTRLLLPGILKPSVHPHMRGEYGAPAAGGGGGGGSSPHAWGIHIKRTTKTMAIRFIPTCVGNTCGWICGVMFWSVHPHMRGEYGFLISTHTSKFGSSPHAWGIPLPGLLSLDSTRFIPTCVGNTLRNAAREIAAEVHPHMRGEYAAIVHSAAALDRFIPTCVGNTLKAVAAEIGKPVHPHMRGEYEGWQRWPIAAVGSSPHAWGIRAGHPATDGGNRFIPTCVGNTQKRPAYLPPMSVHPHMRGEYKPVGMYSAPVDGSSPHAWGIHRGGLGGLGGGRFIPTCVGNTSPPRAMSFATTVHPHMRGEYAHNQDM